MLFRSWSSEEPGGLAVSPGRSRRKFHAPLHTENVSFILPTEKERGKGGWGGTRSEKSGSMKREEKKRRETAE